MHQPLDRMTGMSTTSFGDSRISLTKHCLMCMQQPEGSLQSIEVLKKGKSAGVDNIPAELFQASEVEIFKQAGTPWLMCKGELSVIC